MYNFRVFNASGSSIRTMQSIASSAEYYCEGATGEVLVAAIADEVGINLGRPDVAAVGLLPLGLLVIHPPVGMYG